MAAMAQTQQPAQEEGKMKIRKRFWITFYVVFLPVLTIGGLAPSPYKQWGLFLLIPSILSYGVFIAITEMASEQIAIKFLPYVIATSLAFSPFIVFSTGQTQEITLIVVGSLFGLIMLYGLVASLVTHIKNFPGRKTVKELEQIQQKVTTIPPEELAKPRCTICKEESPYEICLTCEKTFQGERHKVRSQILRAKQAGTPATLTLPEWLETLQSFHSHCAYCYGPYQCIEHYIPIGQGGGTTKENCVPACFKCNAKKSNKHPEK